MNDSNIDQSWLEKDAVPGPVPPSRIPRQSASAPLPGAQSRLAGSLIGLVAVVTLLTAGIVLFLLSEAGTLTLGIESWWGLSNRPAEALALASQTLSGTDRYRAELDLTLTHNGVPSLPTIAEAGTSGTVAGIQTASAASVETTLHLLAAQDVTPEASRLAARLVSQTTSAEVQALPLFSGVAPTRINLITTDSSLYLNLPEADAEGWVKAQKEELAGLAVSTVAWPALVGRLGTDLITGERLGGRTINGESAKGYRIVLPAVEIARLLAPSLPVLSGSLTVKTWIGTRTHQPLLIELTGTAGNGTLTGTITFKDFDGAVAVGLPDPEHVTEQPLATWLQTNHILAGDTAIGRDARRKRDLAAIQTALEEFAAAQSPFAYPQVDLPAGQAGGTVPISDLAGTLKPYLDPLPSDPSENRSYLYNSDGNGYELQATLEETSEVYRLTP